MNQITTHPVEISQAFHLHSQLTPHWISLSQIQHSEPSYTTSGDTSSFPVIYPTTIYPKYIHKSQMDFPVIATRLNYSPAATLLQL